MYTSLPGSGAMTPRTPGIPSGQDGERDPLLDARVRDVGEVEAGGTRTPKGEHSRAWRQDFVAQVLNVPSVEGAHENAWR